ncbi:MAG TPA: DUF5985 family protein [Candidatus Saccharimonadia bacterium]|nr:DUF5985 family protein [Candidatus Saccharimonadia bacterium]
MSEIIYALCAITSILCSVLLLRSWLATRTPLLLWSGICFAGLALTNVMLVLDEIVFTEADLIRPRLWVSLGALVVMLCGLIFSDE